MISIVERVRERLSKAIVQTGFNNAARLADEANYADLSDLAAEEAALRKDAERYRTLKDNLWWRDEETDCGRWMSKLFRKKFSCDLDAAIDAAMKGGNQGQK